MSKLPSSFPAYLNRFTFGGGVNYYGSESDNLIVAATFGDGFALIVSNFFSVPGPIVLLLMFLKVDLVLPVKFCAH